MDEFCLMYIVGVIFELESECARKKNANTQMVSFCNRHSFNCVWVVYNLTHFGGFFIA